MLTHSTALLCVFLLAAGILTGGCASTHSATSNGVETTQVAWGRPNAMGDTQIIAADDFNQWWAFPLYLLVVVGSIFGNAPTDNVSLAESHAYPSATVAPYPTGASPN